MLLKTGHRARRVRGSDEALEQLMDLLEFCGGFPRGVEDNPLHGQGFEVSLVRRYCGSASIQSSCRPLSGAACSQKGQVSADVCGTPH